jgi:hypothetical protein
MTNKITSEQLHRKQLRQIVNRRNIKTVLEFGLEMGTSTRAFLEAGCQVTSIDMTVLPDVVIRLAAYCRQWRHYEVTVEQYLKSLAWIDAQLVYYDITYYTGVAELGTPAAYRADYEGHQRDLPIIWEKMREKALLVLPDFLDTWGKRRAVRDAVCDFAYQIKNGFSVMPNRGGLVIFKKNKRHDR